MPKIEPVYEPRGQDAFDGGEDDFEQEDEGSRLPLLIVIGLLVLAAFGGVVWLAYQHGVERGMKDAPRIVAGTETPSTSPDYNKIYQKPAPSDQDTANDDTAPAGPTFMNQPTIPTTAPPAATPPASSKPAPTPSVAATSAPGTTAKTIATPPPSTAVPSAPVKKVVAPPPVPQSDQPQATKPPAELMSDTHTASTTTAEAKPVAPPPAASIPPPSTPAEAAPAASGDYVLQIGSYKSQDEASASWKSYKAKHAIAGSYPESIKQVDLGAKGTWYRLRIGGFASKDAATSFCAKLKAGGGDCIPAKS